MYTDKKTETTRHIKWESITTAVIGKLTGTGAQLQGINRGRNMMTDNPVALRGGKGYRDLNTKKHTHIHTKKGRPVTRWSCESARLPGPYLAMEKHRSSLELSDATKAQLHQRRSEYNTERRVPSRVRGGSRRDVRWRTLGDLA